MSDVKAWILLLFVGYLLLGGAAAARRMQQVKQWLLDNIRLITAVILGLLGALMAAKGLTALLT